MTKTDSAAQICCACTSKAKPTPATLAETHNLRGSVCIQTQVRPQQTDVVQIEDNLPATYSEFPNLIMVIGWRCNCSDEVNQGSVTHLFCRLDSRFSRHPSTFFLGKLTVFWKFVFFSILFFSKVQSGHVTSASRRAVMTRAAQKDMQMHRLTITIDHCQEKGWSPQPR